MQFFVFVFDLCNSYLAFVFLFVKCACVLKGLRCSYRIRLECGPAVVSHSPISYLYLHLFLFVFLGIGICICWNVYWDLLECAELQFRRRPARFFIGQWFWYLYLYLLEWAFVFVGMCICICWNVEQLQFGQRPLRPLIGRQNTMARPIRIKNAIEQILWSIQKKYKYK